MNNNNSRLYRNKHHKFHWIKFIIICFLIIFLMGIALFIYYIQSAPKLSANKLECENTATIYDSSNQPITTLNVGSQILANQNEIPNTLKNAIISIEDRHFYQEKLGIDPIRIIEAAFNDITGHSNLGLQGGSTLTQQLVKLSFFSTKASDRTLKVKAQETWLAMQVSKKYSKQQVLQFYINKVYMGNGNYGMMSAAKYYFNKTLNQLSLPQLALLAGIPQSPNGYNPYLYPQQALWRRNLVLTAMYKNNKINYQEFITAKNTPISDGLVPQKKLQLQNHTKINKITDNYVEEVVNEVKNKMHLNPFTENIKIYTNLNLNLQKKLYQIVNTNNYVNFPNNKLQVAVTMINPNNGKIIAEIGGRKVGNVMFGYNRAVITNQSNGSTMKPIMDYGPAIEYNNWSTYTLINDTPYKYPGTSTKLYDWDHKYLGKITMRKALVLSRNIPAIRTLHKIGLKKALRFTNGLGINLPKREQVLSSGIGADVSTVQDAAAYVAFDNGGTYYKPFYINKIVLPDGTTYRYNSKGHRAMKPSTAYMITNMLEGVPKANIGMAANIPNLYQAGKSGSVAYSNKEMKKNSKLSQLCKDAWYTGYTRHAVISVWTGYDQPLKNGLTLSQESISQEIYKSLMSYYSNQVSNINWHMPKNVIGENIINNSPMPGVIASKNSSPNSYTYQLYIIGTQPKQEVINNNKEYVNKYNGNENEYSIQNGLKKKKIISNENTKSNNQIQNNNKINDNSNINSNSTMSSSSTIPSNSTQQNSSTNIKSKSTSNSQAMSSSQQS